MEKWNTQISRQLLYIFNTNLVFNMSDLKVWAGHAFGQLSEEGLHNLDELWRLNDIQDLLKFIEEHHLFWTVGLWPIL